MVIRFCPLLNWCLLVCTKPSCTQSRAPVWKEKPGMQAPTTTTSMFDARRMKSPSHKVPVGEPDCRGIFTLIPRSRTSTAPYLFIRLRTARCFLSWSAFGGPIQCHYYDWAYLPTKTSAQEGLQTPGTTRSPHFTSIMHNHGPARHKIAHSLEEERTGQKRLLDTVSELIMCALEEEANSCSSCHGVELVAGCWLLASLLLWT